MNTSQPASAPFAQSYVFTVNDAFVFIFSVGGHLEGSPEASCRVLCASPREHGIPVADLVAATGMSRRWASYRLRTLADADQPSRSSTASGA